ncbi:MAG: hypothetical protein ACRC5T_09970 [Cetobacterium sp.]
MKKIILAVSLAAVSFSSVAWEKSSDYHPTNERSVTQRADGKNLTHLSVGNYEGMAIVGHIKVLKGCPEKNVIVTVNGAKVAGYQMGDTFNGFSRCIIAVYQDTAEQVIQDMKAGNKVTINGDTFTTIGFTNMYEKFVK